MFVLWGVQLLLNLIAAAILFFLFREYRKTDFADQRDRLQAYLKVVGERTEEHERQWQCYRAQVEEEIRHLKETCNKANQILERNRHALGAEVPSAEECELRAVVNVSPGASEDRSIIPSVKDVEATRRRLSTESTFDLKTILREQLA